MLLLFCQTEPVTYRKQWRVKRIILLALTGLLYNLVMHVRKTSLRTAAFVLVSLLPLHWAQVPSSMA